MASSSSASTSSNRKLNSLETRLHQSALHTGRVRVSLCYSASFISVLIPRYEASCPKRNRRARSRTPWTNKCYQFPSCGCTCGLYAHIFVLSVSFQGLFKLMSDANGNLSYRAVQKNELDACDGGLLLSSVLSLTSLSGKRD